MSDLRARELVFETRRFHVSCKKMLLAYELTAPSAIRREPHYRQSVRNWSLDVSKPETEQLLWSLSLGVEQPQCQAGPSLSSNDDGRNSWSSTSTPPILHRGFVLR